MLGAALINTVLAAATGEAARRRGDARLVLVSLAFLAAAGFLALHALATPGVLLDGPNSGFVLATPVGLLLAAGAGRAVLVSARRPARGPASCAPRGAARAVLLGADGRVGGPLAGRGRPAATTRRPTESGSPTLTAFWPRPASRCTRWPRCATCGSGGATAPSLLALVVAAFVLLAEAMIAVAFARNWHASWWEWHLLMLVAFGLVAVGARREAPQERFSDLYLDQTAAGRRDVSIVFADLVAFTAFSDGREPREVSAMLNTYFEVAIPPIVNAHGGEIDSIIGDALMATFNTRGDQPDHAAAGRTRRARPAGARQRDRRRAPRVAAVPRGGQLGRGDGGHRRRPRGAQLHGHRRHREPRPPHPARGAPRAGSRSARRRCAGSPGARVRPLGPLEIRGKREPVDVFVLEGL